MLLRIIVNRLHVRGVCTERVAGECRGKRPQRIRDYLRRRRSRRKHREQSGRVRHPLRGLPRGWLAGRRDRKRSAADRRSTARCHSRTRHACLASSGGRRRHTAGPPLAPAL